jgi:hypothetical protein
MIAYEAIGPNAAGDFIIAYATPGAPHIMTAAGVASSERCAKDECVRLNEAQVTGQREAIVRAANLILLDRER